MPAEKRHSRLFGTLLTILLASVAGSAMAQGVNGSRYPITATDVAKELGVAGINLDASQIHLPVNMNASSASPNLEIVTVRSLKDNHVRLELRCRTTSECLPFLATLDIEDADALTAAIRLKADSTNSASPKVSQPGGMQIDQELRGFRGDRGRLRVGSQAVMEIRDGHIDIHLQVLAIDSGSIGQQVRVCTLDRKKVFHATVTGEGSVSGVME